MIQIVPLLRRDFLRIGIVIKPIKCNFKAIDLVIPVAFPKDVVIDRSQFERWPPVFVVQELLDQIGEVEDGSEEDDARIGVATEDMDAAEVEGDVPMTTSAIVDIDGVSQPSQLKAIQHISLWKNDAIINVVTGNSILSEESLPSYFTAAFPTIFTWGTGKHIDNRRSGSLTLNKWVKLLLRN